MTRAFSALGLVLALIAAPRLAQAEVVELRPQLVSHGAEVTLADLFDISGPAGGLVLAHAAPPGLDAILDAGAVQLAVRRAGYEWPNSSGSHRIAVSSSPNPQSGEPALRASSAPGRARAQSRSARSPAALAYARNVMTGEILRADDLIWSNEVVAPTDAVVDPDMAIGKAARHALRSGAAAAAHDLANPVVIRRDDLIAVVFDSDGVSLTLQAKALSDASVGQTLEVMNTQSKKVIEAVCDGPDQAVVGPKADALRAQTASDDVQGRLVTASLH